jgi:ornithine decarboxylase
MEQVYRRTRVSKSRRSVTQGPTLQQNELSNLELQELRDNVPATEHANSGLARFASIEDMVKAHRPCEPVYCLHPEKLTEAANLFLSYFPGRSLYAVKTNPDVHVLRGLYAAGIRSFDTASLGEIKLIHGLFPDAFMAYMHPVKSREAIRCAYFDYGVRAFSIDSFEEMHKILEETRVAADLTIIVRLAMPRGSATYDLSGKFGASPELAAQLLANADKVAHAVGLSFHVGSQTQDPTSYAEAIRLAGDVVRQSGVALDVFDVGGGYPAAYSNDDVVRLTEFFDVIRDEVKQLELSVNCQVWGEPGRAMVAAAETLVVRVELRKDNVLYINDGGYGGLFDACFMNWTYPVNLIRQTRKGRKADKALVPYSFFGPTCDSIDFMKGPFMLPTDVCEGDWISISQMGAYGRSMQSRFNGFYSDHLVVIDPLAPPAKAKKPVPATEKIVRFSDYL